MVLATQPGPEYWSAVAQLLPLVGLGVVVEARALSTQWDRTPGWLRWLQSALWSAILVALTLSESTALKALRGEAVAAWWPSAAEMAVSSGLGVIIMAPALQFLAKGNAWPIASLVAWHPLLRVASWRHRRESKHLRGQILARQLRLVELAREATSITGPYWLSLVAARAEALDRIGQYEDALAAADVEQTMSPDDYARLVEAIGEGHAALSKFDAGTAETLIYVDQSILNYCDALEEYSQMSDLINLGVDRDFERRARLREVLASQKAAIADALMEWDRDQSPEPSLAAKVSTSESTDNAKG